MGELGSGDGGESGRFEPFDQLAFVRAIGEANEAQLETVRAIFDIVLSCLGGMQEEITGLKRRIKTPESAIARPADCGSPIAHPPTPLG